MHQCVKASLEAGLGTIVVLGSQADRVKEALASLASPHLSFVTNDHYADGQFSSTQCGVSSLEPGENFFITLGDMPLLTAESYDFIARELTSMDDGVRPFDKEKPGHPVLLRSYLGPFIRNAKGEQSMNHLLSRFTIRQLATADKAFYADIDTWQDYQNIKR